MRRNFPRKAPQSAWRGSSEWPMISRCACHRPTRDRIQKLRATFANLKIWLPSSWEHIKAIVKNGWVTPEGEVEWNYQREYAERAVRWIKGVKGVSNLIRLHPRVAPSPTEIKQKIEEAFRRSALIDPNRARAETGGGG